MHYGQDKQTCYNCTKQRFTQKNDLGYASTVALSVPLYSSYKKFIKSDICAKTLKNPTYATLPTSICKLRYPTKSNEIWFPALRNLRVSSIQVH